MTDQGRPLLPTALDLGTKRHYGKDEDRIEEFDRLSHSMELFSSDDEHCRYLARDPFSASPRYCTATVSQCLCYFLDYLRSICSLAENARMVHIVPGPIQMGDKQFYHVYDTMASNEIPNTKPPVQADLLEIVQPSSILRQLRRFDGKMDILGTENATEAELTVYYRATIPGGPTIRLRPGRISQLALKWTGILTSEHLNCTERLIMLCALVRQGWRVSDESDVQTWVAASTGPQCLIWPQMDDLARCVAIQLHAGGFIAIWKIECISCCLVSLLQEMPKENRKDLYHLM